MVNAVLRLKEFVCGLAEQSKVFEGGVMNAVLGLTELMLACRVRVSVGL